MCAKSEMRVEYPVTETKYANIKNPFITDKRQIYMSSVVNLSNFWTKDGGLSAYAQELLQLLDAGYTRVCYDMYPP
jgi:hypothetical protein